MIDNQIVVEKVKEAGKVAAEAIQLKAETMTGTELYEKEDFIPKFKDAIAKKNMLERKAGQTDGFICKSSAGRVVRLIQNYDSTVYTGEPEELPAQWGFVWSNEPAYAKPFVAISTSPYMTGNCCIEDEVIYKSVIDNNVWKPSEYSQGWEIVNK